MGVCEDQQFITCDRQLSWEQLFRLLTGNSVDDCPALRTVASEAAPVEDVGAFDDSFDDSFDN